MTAEMKAHRKDNTRGKTMASSRAVSTVQNWAESSEKHLELRSVAVTAGSSETRKGWSSDWMKAGCLGCRLAKM